MGENPHPVRAARAISGPSCSIHSNRLTHPTGPSVGSFGWLAGDFLVMGTYVTIYFQSLAIWAHCVGCDAQFGLDSAPWAQRWK